MKILKKECDILLTVDTTEYSIDTTLVTADRYNSDCFINGTTYYSLMFAPRFKVTKEDVLTVSIVNEFTNKEANIDFTWGYVKEYIRLKFTTEDLIEDNRYSIKIETNNKLLYLGKAIKTNMNPQNYQYTKNTNNKLYL